jgi:DNA-binding NarL/FixJ family response regulator
MNTSILGAISDELQSLVNSARSGVVCVGTGKATPRSGLIIGNGARHGTPTVRKSEVLQLVASGATNREIAAGLGISDNTVKYHLVGLYSKMNIA